MAKASFTLSDGTKVTVASEEEQERLPEGFSIEAFVSELKDDLRANRLKLPTLPTIAIEALMVINDSKSSAKDLAKVISKDTSITARLIRYANSPVYSGLYPVKSIRSAITAIGFQQVKNAIYAVSMHEVFRTSQTDIQRRMEELWAHSVKVAANAAALAGAQSDLDPDVALVAGLIHDIGKIPLLMKACDYVELVGDDKYLEHLLDQLHTGMGRDILQFWEFDPALVAVAAEHENLDRKPEGANPDYVDLIQVANILSYRGTEHQLAYIDREEVGAFSRLGMATEQDDEAEDDESGMDVQGVKDVLTDH
jgi:putative nucleotidyltransferase with HDIG domain